MSAYLYQHISVNDHNSQLLSSPIQRKNSREELINRTGLITLDETSMLNCAAFACIEKVCRSVMNNDLAFGEKAAARRAPSFPEDHVLKLLMRAFDHCIYG
jgi:hypothetical protein